jgi:hypothetical protein
MSDFGDYQNGSGAVFSDSISPTIEGFVLGGTDRSVQAMEDLAPEVLAYAQFNAPWTDRTGLAREGLDVEVYEEFGFVIMDLFHTVDYGLWLEVIQNERFATIMPTLETYAAEIMERAGAVWVDEDEGGF